jgi:PEP-CTERM motif
MSHFKILHALAVCSFALMHWPAAASFLNPNDFTSLGPNPFTWAGTYSVETTGATPTLTGPGISVNGVASTGTVVFTFDNLDTGSGITINGLPNTGARPLALMSRDFFSLTGISDGSRGSGGGHQGGNDGGLSGRGGAGLGGAFPRSEARGVVDRANVRLNALSGNDGGAVGPSGGGAGVPGFIGNEIFPGLAEAKPGHRISRPRQHPVPTGPLAEGPLPGGVTAPRGVDHGGGDVPAKGMEQAGGSLQANRADGSTSGDSTRAAGAGGATDRDIPVHGGAFSLSSSLRDTGGKDASFAADVGEGGEGTALSPDSGTPADLGGSIGGGVVEQQQAIPEPGTLLLLGAGLAGLAASRRKRCDPRAR